MILLTRFAQIPDSSLAAQAPRHWQLRARQMARETLRQQELVVGGLLVESLRACGMDAAGNIEISVEPHGKPILSPPSRLHFNLSHSHGVALCVVGDAPCGCDVERVSSFDDALARHALTEGEYRLLQTAVGEPARREMFFRLWTRKEAFLKAVGRGLDLDPHFVEAAETPARSIPAPEGYCAAVCEVSKML